MIFRNRIIDKGQIKKLIAWAYSNYGTARTAQIADKLKDLGFRFATKAGVSISVDDLLIPEIKKELLEAAEIEIRQTESRYVKGEITEVERFQKVIDTWNSTSETLKNEVVTNFKAIDPLNSVYMMAFSGARGNLSQVRQLVGMRGLMADPQGEIIDIPIKTNFREGLTVTEYIISSYGARKGLVDTALRTADSGYLTRRLVDVSQDVIVREVDCGTMRNITIVPMRDEGKTLISLSDRLLGRVIAENVFHPTTGELLAPRNKAVSETLAKEIEKAGVESVQVRSPLTCESGRSVCQSCYGWSLAHGKTVDLGEAIGIIAAQSIGEPGTQLTMRTFHTGGVFTGEDRTIRAKFDGTVKFDGLRTRPVRTRHGEDFEQAENNAQLILIPKNKEDKRLEIELTAGSTVMVPDGAKVKKDDKIAEIAIAKARRTTERAAKDVVSDLAGEVFFEDLVAEEKTDRQGNTTRLAQRGGLLWILSGEVYNLPPGAEPTVKNGDYVTKGSVLAETKLSSSNGGTVRLTGEREIEIITASVSLDDAIVKQVSSGGRGEHYVIYTNTGHKFSLKSTPGTKVQNHQVVAELIDDSYRTQTGGTVKYANVEVIKKGKGTKTGFEVVKGGTLLWIPEECHDVNKDSSLLLVEDKQYVEAGTEIVRDIFCQTAGVVDVTQKNDILREIVIKPGDLHLVDNDYIPPEVLEIGAEIEGILVQPGQEFLPGMPVFEELRYAEYIETTEGWSVLFRPVVEYPVPDTPSLPTKASTTGTGVIELKAVQRLPFKDGERVKSVEGVELLRTQLILEWRDIEAQGLAADIELIPIPAEEVEEEDEELDELGEVREKRPSFELQLVILESLIIRRDLGESLIGITNTKIMVESGDVIPPGAVVSRTEIQCRESGEVRGLRSGDETVRRVLIFRSVDQITINCDRPPVVKRGNLIVAGTEIAPDVRVPESGLVVNVTELEANSPGTESNLHNNQGNLTEGSAPYTVTVRLARPYRVSQGAILHIDNGDLVQRGDSLVLLVFERAKTGDIIQGLPRIEELLEARRPKEACILAKHPGRVVIDYIEDEQAAVRVIGAEGTMSEYSLLPGQNVIVSDDQEIDVGEPITDGPSNPHEILEIFFDFYKETLGLYDAALLALQKVQNFLVNEVQSVYQSQGIDIADKHIEVIVRQMTSKVRIDDEGDTTTILPGELVELREIENINQTMSITGQAPAHYTPILLGITKASLNTDSFISAASFQETTRVLTEAAIEGKSDWLRGLKENVIIGRLIPAGTGFNAFDDLTPSLRDSNDIDDLADDLDILETDDVLDDDTLSNPSLDVVLDDRSARNYRVKSKKQSSNTPSSRKKNYQPPEDIEDDEDDDLAIDPEFEEEEFEEEEEEEDEILDDDI